MILGSVYVTAGALVLGAPIALLTSVFLAGFCPKGLYRIVKPCVNLLSCIPSVVYGFFGMVVLAPLVPHTFGGAVRLTSETLSGIPSIVYGLFGMLFFVTRLGWGYSLLAGACTLSMMILPLIMRTTEEAMISVPDTYREGSFGLGAGRLRTVFAIELPSAVPGILAGIVLAVGRTVEETAAGP